MIDKLSKNLEYPQKNNRKLKVLWLCYFTNNEIQDQLKPFKLVGEIASWISNMIPLFENDNEVELHVVSPHEWIAGYTHFEKKGVFYYFINKGIPFIGRHWPRIFRFDIWTDLFLTKKKVDGIINKVKPDIIHLHGTENVFCTVITQFYKKYPVFITIQGFIHNSTIKNKVVERRIQKELKIMKLFNHYGYRTVTMGQDIKAINPKAVLHWHNYPNKPIHPINADKVYDLVFFARICKDKGIEDLLKAISIVKKNKQDITCCIIGGGNIDGYKRLASELGIQNNINWAGFLPTQEDVHKLASSAKISVLPTYHDIISGTIIESLYLKLPVVAYNVGSIHEINKNHDIVSLIEKFDINGLANGILVLLKDEKLRNEKAILGYHRIKEMFDTNYEQIRNDLLKAYYDVINNFKNS